MIPLDEDGGEKSENQFVYLKEDWQWVINAAKERRAALIKAASKTPIKS